MQLFSKVLHRNDTERRSLSQAAQGQQWKIAYDLDGQSILGALFFGILCAMPTALGGLLLVLIRL
ncbi:hypothetical protein [Cupriavidus oxalaticus]|uniref:Uncharacterized protein n=1 Tax=Cupriavidus oxalaticus TaxID=96344 RepID=A0A4P7LI84_9BURK|nr:hypothetical protein [Cupriavidus oxalaticus]QBY55358.1 hypothetical protein E0W60_30285 [Cupriavidus oxalaticus]